MADTLYADVSEWRVDVDDRYPYRVLCIRSNDGTYRDRHWVNNYDWCLRNVDNGRLEFFVVYFVWRPRRRFAGGCAAVRSLCHELRRWAYSRGIRSRMRHKHH